MTPTYTYVATVAPADRQQFYADQCALMAGQDVLCHRFTQHPEDTDPEAPCRILVEGWDKPEREVKRGTFTWPLPRWPEP